MPEPRPLIQERWGREISSVPAMHGLGAAVVLGVEGVVFPCLMRSFERRCYEYEKIFLLVLFLLFSDFLNP